jgi:ADP-ribose pyrophosphatase YjhB (NUDIX family)
MPKRFRPFAAVYLILKKDGKILMAKRKNTGYQDGNYSLVSGHIDGGESATQALIREVKEEAGIKLKTKDLKVVYILHRLGGREYIDIYFQAENWEGKIKNMEPEKCEELKWFPEDSLPQNTVPEVRLVLEDIKRGNFYGEQGF